LKETNEFLNKIENWTDNFQKVRRK